MLLKDLVQIFQSYIRTVTDLRSECTFPTIAFCAGSLFVLALIKHLAIYFKFLVDVWTLEGREEMIFKFSTVLHPQNLSKKQFWSQTHLDDNEFDRCVISDILLKAMLKSLIIFYVIIQKRSCS